MQQNFGLFVREIKGKPMKNKIVIVQPQQACVPDTAEYSRGQYELLSMRYCRDGGCRPGQRFNVWYKTQKGGRREHQDSGCNPTIDNF